MKLIVPNEVKKLASLFARHGKPLYIVGGFIRDSFLGVKNSDIDLASCATIKDIIDILYNTEFTIKVKSERLSTIEISCGELRMEHATFRREWYEGSGGHTPTSVEFVDSIEEDYIRRDFTINAIYYDITNDTIVDPCEGMVDLSHYLVKSVTIPRMVFENDGLRILRMIRLACTLVLDIDGNTFKSAKENIFRLQFISASRIRDEFSRIIQADIEHPEVEGHETAHSRGLLLLGEIGAWAYIIPQIESMRTNEMMFSGNERLYDHVIRVVELSAPEVRLSALLHDIGKETCMKMQGNFNDHAIVGAALIEDILGSEGLNYPRDVVMRVKQIIAGHNFDKYGLAFESTIRRFIFENKEVFYLIVLLKHATVRAKKPWLENSKIATRWDNIYKRMIEEKAPLDIKDLAVTGGYIKEHLQCVRDAEISQLMLYLQRRAVVNVKLNNKESLTNLALKWIKKFRTIVRR